MLAFAILDRIAHGLVLILPRVWSDRIKYNASDLTVFVPKTQLTKTKPRMTMVEAVFATMLFDLALFGTDNFFINFIIRAFTKFQNSWDKPFSSPEEAEKEIKDLKSIKINMSEDPPKARFAMFVEPCQRIRTRSYRVVRSRFRLPY